MVKWEGDFEHIKALLKVGKKIKGGKGVMISEVTNEDCMVMMARYPDKFFDLAIVDPPYGIGKDGQKKTTGGNGGQKGL